MVHNPAITPDVAARATHPSGHPWLDEKDRPVVLGAGSLIEVKDFATLIRAFAHLRRTRPTRLLILGEGRERPHLERLAHEMGVAADVHLPGFAADPYAFMARADGFALSSRTEGLSNVVVEALYCGCPVVATDCPGGTGEVLTPECLVPVGDAGRWPRRSNGC